MGNGMGGMPGGGMGGMPGAGMGGMGGGMGGNRSRGASMFDDDDMGMFTSPGGMPGGMPGGRPGSSRRSPRTSTQPSQPSEISKPLPISLEDLYQGVAKRMKVSRKLLNGMAEEKASPPRIQSASRAGSILMSG